LKLKEEVQNRKLVMTEPESLQKQGVCERKIRQPSDEEPVFDVDDLKSVIMLTYLNDSMLKKIAKITLGMKYRPSAYIFKEGDHAEYLYSVIDGKVGLELEKNSSTLILINTITRGMTFGLSALVDTEEKKYTSNAKALTDTNLFTWKGTDLDALFLQDYEMGFLFTKRIAKIAKTRLQIRNVQFLDIYS
jgi:CRP-like cAMP-binding protein